MMAHDSKGLETELGSVSKGKKSAYLHPLLFNQTTLASMQLPKNIKICL